MSLPYLVDSQVPEFVRADHPAFTEFLKAYYTWLTEVYSVGKIEDLVDIDNTVDEFLEYFKKELDINGVFSKSDNRTYLKHIKELYKAKGSTSGYDFLFKLLYNKESSITHPWDYVFKPSEGKWRQDVTILVDITTGNSADFLDNLIIITDEAGITYKTFVSNINVRSNGVVELFIGRFTHKADLVSVANLTGTVAGNILNTTVKGVVDQAGSGFIIGQVFTVNSYGGSGTLIKVKSVNANGGITAVEIIAFGTGYLTDFNILITPTNFIDPTTLGARIGLYHTKIRNIPPPTGPLVTEYVSAIYASNDNIDSQNESGSIVAHNYTDLGTTYLQDPTYVGNTLAEFRSQEGFGDATVGNYASIKLITGHVCIYTGYYEESTNIIGDLMYIQDSYYYQAFSYVTSLEETIDSYGSIVKKVLHPAGTKHFARYEITDNFNLTPTVESVLNLIVFASALRDFVATVDALIFALSYNISDTFSVSELINFVIDYKREFEDTISTSDAKNLNVGKSVVESFTATDTISNVVDYKREHIDTFSTTDLASTTVLFNISATDVTITSDQIANTTTFDRSTVPYTDTFIASESISLQARPTLLDTTSTTDVAEFTSQFNIDPNDSVSITDSAAVLFNSNIIDVTITSDQIANTTTFDRSTVPYTDDATAVELISLQARPTLLDTTSATDLALLTLISIIEQNDSVSITDSAIQFAGSKNITDLTITSDQIANTVTFDRSTIPFTDTLVASESILFLYDITSSDIINTSDAIEYVTTNGRSFFDIASTTESFELSITPSTVSDSITAVDQFANITTFDRSTVPFTEMLSITDQVQYTSLFDRAFTETAIASDVTLLTIGVPISDSITAVDQFANITTFDRAFTETAIASDVTLLTIGVPIGDSITAVDQFANITTFDRSTVPFTETANTTESFALDFNTGLIQNNVAIVDVSEFSTAKYNTDTVQTSNGMSGLYMEPYYVTPAAGPYWEAEYLEYERAITN